MLVSNPHPPLHLPLWLVWTWVWDGTEVSAPKCKGMKGSTHKGITPQPDIGLGRTQVYDLAVKTEHMLQQKSAHFGCGILARGCVEYDPGW